MYINDFDRNHKNGCKRFLDFWRKISEDKKNIIIIDTSDNINLYSLTYGSEDDKEYISLIYGGVTFFFPLLNIPETADTTINFDDEIVESNLLDLFKLLNNKKNFCLN